MRKGLMGSARAQLLGVGSVLAGFGYETAIGPKARLASG